ncbi:MAG: glutamate--tRNA ligase [Chloroflexi bacterium]|nr:glutamate--tRNA ligase [Chloroflexota bacterium]MYJ58603.1 glutamate--tRNA ligase [Chloroflexota bacterium]
MTVRVRYGPSPTGEPHVGNIRTALFDWLLARRFGGRFIVRIEDTDQSRAVEGAEQLILDALTWLGLDWDEGPDVGGPYAPYRQSERLPMYIEAARRLIDEGKAYRCVCSPERLDALRKAQQKAKQPPGYDRLCRDLNCSADEPHVVRLAMPLSGDTIVNDYLRGDVSFQNALLDDHVLLKRDGFPTYHLASVVDDHYMEITHVIRGEEWLSSAPRHVHTYLALGWDQPAWVHIPIIRGPDGGKLSKRHGATSIRQYAEEGFLPEALLNFLALLGWSKDETTTIMSCEEITEAFNLDGLGLSSAMFDIERLSEMNARYIRDLDPADFLRRGRPHLEDRVGRPIPDDELDRLLTIAPAIQERVKLMPEFADYTDFFFTAGPLGYANADLMGRAYKNKPWAALESVEASLKTLRDVDESKWTTPVLESTLRELATDRGEKPGAVFTPIRVAATGKRIAPPLFETLETLGQELTVERLNAAAERLARPDD